MKKNIFNEKKIFWNDRNWCLFLVQLSIISVDFSFSIRLSLMTTEFMSCAVVIEAHFQKPSQYFLSYQGEYFTELQKKKSCIVKL